MWLLEIALEIAVAWCSWRVWLCILLALGIIGGAYYKFPEHNGFLTLTVPGAIVICAFGFWWQWRVDRC
jgi:hypothetical protein